MKRYGRRGGQRKGTKKKKKGEEKGGKQCTGLVENGGGGVLELGHVAHAQLIVPRRALRRPRAAAGDRQLPRAAALRLHPSRSPARVFPDPQSLV